MEDKKLVVKFEVTCEIDTANVIGDNNEEKLSKWKNDVESTLFDSIYNWSECWGEIKCIKEKIENYKN